MVNLLTVQEFLEKAKQLPVLDARAPKEYAVGHIPQAVSFPIFDDTERATVGTAYKQQGHDPAVLLGLDLFGPKMSAFVKQADKLAQNKELLVHCWRGGMRSSAPELPCVVPAFRLPAHSATSWDQRGQAR